jgi:hypothetical protein
MSIRNVSDAMHEMREGSKHIKTRAQAIAVGLKQERKAGKTVPPKSHSRRMQK